MAPSEVKDEMNANAARREELKLMLEFANAKRAEPESPEELMRFLEQTPVLPLDGARPIRPDAGAPQGQSCRNKRHSWLSCPTLAIVGATWNTRDFHSAAASPY